MKAGFFSPRFRRQGSDARFERDCEHMDPFFGSPTPRSRHAPPSGAPPGPARHEGQVHESGWEGSSFTKLAALFIGNGASHDHSDAQLVE